jgi:hypothetical protein
MGKPILFVYEGDDRADRVAEFAGLNTHTHTCYFKHSLNRICRHPGHRA